jgi:exosortase
MNQPITKGPARRIPIFPWPALVVIALWSWAIWSCAEPWRGNPNYSYGWVVPLLALGFALRRYLQLDSTGAAHPTLSSRIPIAAQIFIGIVFAGAVFFLEYSREQVWHPEIVLWSICLLAITSTIAILAACAGTRLARAELFPVLFFLTAVPWPPRFEQQIVSALMRWVAETTTESLHWLGVEAQTSGAAIALRSGLVGITEACSGVRSLQAGIMFGLAMGEWFLLRPARRIILLLVAVTLAIATNLVRTLLLSLQAERHGVESVEHVHDLIGNIVITSLVIGIWIAGKFLAARVARPVALSIKQVVERARQLFASLTSATAPVLRALAISLIAGIICARTLSAYLERRDQTQTVPFFIAKIDHANGNKLQTVPQTIWNELHPTSGESIRPPNPKTGDGNAGLYHFFWKPSPWNRFVLVHRPDICMPGVGWKLIGGPEPIDVSLDGQPVQFYAFHFQRENLYALELWGVWRNGAPVSLDYQPAQVFGAAIPPPSLQLEGKRKSATEIVACTVIANDAAPANEIAVALLQSVFEYRNR